MTITAPEKKAARQGFDLNALLVQHPEDTYFAYINGRCMAGAFIPPGALLVINRVLSPQNGDVVIARLNGRFIVRFLKKNKYTCWLCAPGRPYRELKITSDMNMSIWGVVTQIVSVADGSAFV